MNISSYYKIEDAKNSINYDDKNILFAYEYVDSNVIKNSDSELPTIINNKRRMFCNIEYDKFILIKNNFISIHEMISNYDNDKIKKLIDGRLVFDFDIQNDIVVPNNFTDIIEKYIILTFKSILLSKKFNIIKDKLEFVWINGNTNKKFSRHLVVKGCIFNEWIMMMKIFYFKLECLWSDNTNNNVNNIDTKWICGKDLFDKQIARNNSSLRMNGTTKINLDDVKQVMPKLSLMDNKYDFHDTTIRCYRTSDINNHVKINKYDIIHSLIILYNSSLEVGMSMEKYLENGGNGFNHIYEKKKITISTPTISIHEAANIVMCMDSGLVLRTLTFDKAIMSRVHSSCCIISGRVHDSIGGFVFFDYSGNARYSCYSTKCKDMGYTSMVINDNK